MVQCWASMAAELRARISVRVQPNAGQSKVMGLKEGVWQVRVAAPPVEGRANEELIRFLSDVLGVSKSSLTIERGLTGRNKVVAVSGLGQDEVLGRLERARSGPRQKRFDRP